MSGRILASVLVLGLCVAGVAASPTAPIRYLFVDEVAARGDALVGKPVHVHGYVQAGSIEHFGRLTRFVLVRHWAAQVTWLDGPLPDTFRDNSEVIVEGHIERNSIGMFVLEGTSVMTKCAVKYGDDADVLDAKFQ